MVRNKMAFLATFILFASAYWVAFKNLPDVTFAFKMTTDAPLNHGNVFWEKNKEGFRPENNRSFSSFPGTHEYKIAIPSAISKLRLDPTSLPGAITIENMRLEFMSIPFWKWGGSWGFKGWYPVHDLGGFRAENGILKMVSTGNDPFFESLSVGRFGALFFLVCVGFMALVSTSLVHFVYGGAKKQTVKMQEASQENWKFMASAVASVISIFIAYIFLFKVRPPVDPGPEYAITLVDRFGMPVISTWKGGVKLELNPFTLYRNFPLQRSAMFSTNSLGYRGPELKEDGRKKVVLLGGSASFGLGLNSDEETISQQWQKLNPKVEIINAGVISFHSGQELSEMVHYADKLNPSTYVTLSGWNDFYTYYLNVNSNGEFGYPGQFLGLIEESLRQQMKQGNEFSVNGFWGGPNLKPRTQGSLELAMETYLENIKKMALFARSRNAKFVVAFQPEIGSRQHFRGQEEHLFEQWKKQTPISPREFSEKYKSFGERVERFCFSEEISFLNLNSDSRLTKSDEQIFWDFVHPASAGAKIIAQIFNETLL